MTEATNSVHLAKLRTTLGAATITLARQSAIKATKAELRAQGLRPTHMPHRDIVVLADAYLANHRDELVAEAKEIVKRWQAEGFFGRAVQDF
jgi:hypothetical protein